MILVDTSVWIDHLHGGDPAMFRLLDSGEVLLHPFVRTEIALGSLRDRGQVLATLGALPTVPVVGTDEVLALVEVRRLFATGLAFTDLHLIASALIDDDTLIWTRDRRLEAVAAHLSISASA